MAYNGIKANELETEELTKLVKRAQKLTEDGYDIINKNYDLFAKIFKRVLKLSKQEKNWHLYFSTIYQIISLNVRHHKYDEVVKYAELYYKECDLYMDRELPNYPNTNMSFYNTWIYDLIFKAYYEYHQIDDTKMDSFMKKYEECALKYGKTYLYYDGEIRLCILYRDAVRVRKAAQNFRRYEKEMFSCYVCGHEPYLYHLLLLGENRQAEQMMQDLVNKNIPKQHLWCYEYCEEAVPDAMYENVLFACIKCGQEESFRYFYKKYWKKLTFESQWKADAWSFKSLLCAFSGFFDKYKDDIRKAEKDMKEVRHETTVSNMEHALGWWCYFTLLGRSGVHEVEIKLPGLNTPDVKTKEDAQTADVGESVEGAEDAGKVSTLAVASYMEKRADELGDLFSKARARFDYEGLKGTYRNCFLPDK